MRGSRMERNEVTECADGRKILRPDDETFAPSDSSIRMQLVTRLFLTRSRKNPAVAAAGSRHAIFPAVSPGRRGVFTGESTRPPLACQLPRAKGSWLCS